MALQQNFDYKGITANYWKIIKTEEDIINSKTKVVLGVYVNKAARDTGIMNILTVKESIIAGIDLERQAVYTAVKQSKKDSKGNETNYFAGAIDV